MRTHHSNRFATELTSAMGGSDTEAAVTTTEGAPASPCYLVIDHDVASKAEIVLFDGSFDGTTFRTTSLSNRYLEGSAADSGITHDTGAKVISAPLGTSMEDIWDQIEGHAAATSGVHGVGSSDVESTAGAQAKIDSANSGNVFGGTAGDPSAVAVHPTAAANASFGSGSIAIGNNTEAAVNDSIAIGNGASISQGPSVAIGAGAESTDSFQFRLGTSDYTISIPGGLSVSGSKNFEIDHPLDSTRTVRHGSYEGPVPGGTVYRYRVTTEDGTGEVELPDYFAALNTDTDVHVSPIKHFGRAYGKVDGNTLTVTAESDGEYAVLILGTRNDDRARETWKVYAETKPAGRMWNGEKPETAVGDQRPTR